MKETNFSSSVDNNTLYRTKDNIEEVIMVLWQSNINKCHILVNRKDEVIKNLGETEIKNSEYGKLLGIKVDAKLSFNEHLNDITSKASPKVNALSRIVPWSI